MIDYHCHILPSLDDGSDSLDESLEMGRALMQAGFSTVYCTPHCMKGVFETAPTQVREGVAALQKEFDQAGIALRLEPGMEYFLDEYFAQELDRLLPLGETGMVLVEAPNTAEPGRIKDAVFQLTRRRLVPLIAHPERTPVFQVVDRSGFFNRVRSWIPGMAPALDIEESFVAELKNMGCRYQGNLGSLSGYYGSAVMKQASILREEDLYYCFGTDAHHSKQIRNIVF